MDRLKIIVKLFRVHQWVKNVLCFAGLFFAQKLLDGDAVLSALRCFFAFSFAASGVYILNDLSDLERDRVHPKKRSRPLPSGRISRSAAWALLALSFAGSTVLAVGLSRWISVLLLAYVAQNFLYSWGLKKVPILDVFIVSSGFVWRALAGVLAVNAPVSSWLVLCTFLLSLLISFAKRKSEFVSLGESAGDHRDALRGYTLAQLDSYLSIMAGCAILCYALYCLDVRTIEKFGHNLLITFPFVVFGILRFLHVATNADESDPILVFFKDRALVLSALSWGLSLMGLLYFAH